MRRKKAGDIYLQLVIYVVSSLDFLSSRLPDATGLPLGLSAVVSCSASDKGLDVERADRTLSSCATTAATELDHHEGNGVIGRVRGDI